MHYGGPIAASLTFGSLINYKIEGIRLKGTKIPHYGFCSTVMCSEKRVDRKTKLSYVLFLFIKGAVYVGLYILFFFLFNKGISQLNQARYEVVEAD